MTTTADHPPRSMRTFYTIWAGQLISLIGSQLTSFALAVWLVEQTGKATPFALTVLFANLPGLLLAPLAGSVVDRVSRRMVMILADSGAALVTMAGAALLLTGNLQVWHVYLIAMFGSAFGAFQEPAYQAAITMLVPKEQYGRASGMVQTASAIAQLIAPLAAGFLYLAIGLRGIILIDFVTYFFAVGALLVVNIPDPEAMTSPETKERSMWQDASFGWRYITARRGLLGMLVYFAMVNFFANGSAVLSPPMILASESPAVLGTVQGVAGVGMLIGSVLMSSWGGPKGNKNMLAVFGFILVFALGFVVFGLRPSPWLYGLGFALTMFAVPLASGNSQAIWLRKVAPDVQGRVFAARTMMSRGIMPLAFLLAGPLADRVFEPLMAEGGALAPVFGPLIGVGEGRGIALMFVVSGVFIMIVTAVAFAIPAIRNVETDLPDAAPDEAAQREDSPALADEAAPEPIV